MMMEKIPDGISSFCDACEQLAHEGSGHLRCRECSREEPLTFSLFSASMVAGFGDSIETRVPLTEAEEYEQAAIRG